MVSKFVFLLLGAFLFINVAHCQRRLSLAQQSLKTIDTYDDGLEAQKAQIEQELAMETEMLSTDNGEELMYDADRMAAVEAEVLYKMDIYTSDVDLQALSADTSVQSLAREVISNTAESLGGSSEMAFARPADGEELGAPETAMMKGIFDWIKKIALAAINGIKNIITNVINVINNIISKVGPIIKWLLGKLKDLVVKVLNWINQLIAIIQGALEDICKIVKQIISILNTALPIITKIAKLIGGNLGSTITNIANSLSNVLKYIKALASVLC